MRVRAASVDLRMPPQLRGEMVQLCLDGGDALELHVQRVLHLAADGFQGGEALSQATGRNRWFVVISTIPDGFYRTLTTSMRHERHAVYQRLAMFALATIVEVANAVSACAI